jgi:hypothetical protein
MEQGVRNLSPNRGPNIWDDPRWNQPVRVNMLGRCLFGVGGALLIVGAMRGSAARRLVGMAGGLVALTIASGRLNLEGARGWLDRALAGLSPESDQVHDQSESSFPASDAPAWTPTTGTSRSWR